MPSAASAVGHDIASGALSSALARLAAAGPSATVVAGGTDVYPALGDRDPPLDLLDLHGIAELAGIVERDGAIEIGAGTTWRALTSASLPPAFAALQHVAAEVGSVQIQSRGTLGGNLCTASPAADGVPPLLALDARVRLASVRGTRELTLPDFLLGPRRTAREPDELLIAVVVPTPPGDAMSSFLKLGSRRYLVISIAMLACTLRVDAGRLADVRIAVGACSPVAVRLRALERALEGVEIDEVGPAIVASLAAGALDVLQPIDDVRASAAYRRDAVATAIGRLVVHTASLAPPGDHGWGGRALGHR